MLDTIHSKPTTTSAAVLEAASRMGVAILEKSTNVNFKLDGTDIPKETVANLIQQEIMDNLSKKGVKS